MMTKRFGKKWLVLVFALLSLALLVGCVNNYDDLAAKHNAIAVEEWAKISAKELADALEKGEFNPRPTDT